ncbi:tetratricopeptide repeat protein [Solidesulfovibrio sp.]|uniref:tetratricopeptide repeat protein n=1 Tax=Solidesulfovibrio sp. TaxID=2910990 RepID=UPI002615D3BB|nr:tetratricopeptide repeat protein [Solidesulfovibrio sp.]
MHGGTFPRFALVAAALALVLCGCQKQPSSAPVGTTAAVPAAPAAASRLEAGKRAAAAGDCAKAMDELAEAARLDDGSVEARLYLGLCAAKTGDLARAENALGEAAARDPNDPRPLEALGIALYAAGRRDAAGQRLAEAVRRGSRSAQVQYYLGNLAMIAGDCREGLTAYRKAMILDPSYAPAVTEYKNARVSCARAETPPAEPPALKPGPKPAPKPQPQGAPAPAAAAPAPAQGAGGATHP